MDGLSDLESFTMEDEESCFEEVHKPGNAPSF